MIFLIILYCNVKSDNYCKIEVMIFCLIPNSDKLLAYAMSVSVFRLSDRVNTKTVMISG